MKAAALALGLLLAGCTSKPPGAEDPVWGKQPCAHCAMLVSEKPPSAQAITADGRRHFFDDVGCLVAWEERAPRTVSARWVRGPGGSGWVDPVTARFSSGNATPMDFGFLAATQGLTFDEVRAAVRVKTSNRSPEPTP